MATTDVFERHDDQGGLDAMTDKDEKMSVSEQKSVADLHIKIRPEKVF